MTNVRLPLNVNSDFPALRALALRDLDAKPPTRTETVVNLQTQFFLQNGTNNLISMPCQFCCED